jgi:hypothetical protein
MWFIITQDKRSERERETLSFFEKSFGNVLLSQTYWVISSVNIYIRLKKLSKVDGVIQFANK